MLCVKGRRLPEASAKPNKRVSTPETSAPAEELETSPRKKSKTFRSFGWSSGDESDDLPSQGVIATPAPGQGIIEIDEDSWGKKFHSWFLFGPQQTNGGSQLNGAVRDSDPSRDGSLANGGSSSGILEDGHGQQLHGRITLAELDEEMLSADDVDIADVDIDAALRELSELDVKAVPTQPPPAQAPPRFGLPQPRFGLPQPRFGLTCCVAPRKDAKPAKRTVTGMAAQKPLVKGAQKPAPKAAKPKQGLVWKPVWTPGSG